MKKYSTVVEAIREEDVVSGKMKSYMRCYFENPVDAAKFYQLLKSQPEVIFITIYAAPAEEQA